MQKVKFLELPQNKEYNPGDIGFVLLSATLVFLMVPGVGYFYSGMARSKNALSMILLSVLCVAVVSLQWWLMGYSLVYSQSGGRFIGNFEHAFLNYVEGNKSVLSDKIPELVFAFYQLMLAAVTPALAIGAAAERSRLLPTVIFIFIWTTLVYDVIAYWTWSPNGWIKKFGTIDFAGGIPVHITSGASALAYCIMIGKRHGHGTEEFRPHNVSNIALGTVFMWFGWFGFNGGSAHSANLRAANAIFVANLAAGVGGLTWMFLDFRIERKLSTLSFCSGVIAGLVTITPASGYVSPSSAILFGIVGGVCCNLGVRLKQIFQFDDALDVFAVHGVGGTIGNLLTGVFAQKSIAFYGMSEKIEGGWVDKHWIQLGYQFVGSLAGLAYSFSVTYIILFFMNKVPGLNLRIDAESEKQGVDVSDIGEVAYYHVSQFVSGNPKTGQLRPVQDSELIFQSKEVDNGRQESLSFSHY
ncbi:hypothetical protein G9A89_022984 [Geosiphon pyriformis]|nr:hypothetical protein G9A89_022984 [Geosiphon pyriformis]